MRILALILGVIFIAAAGCGLWVYRDYDAPGPLSATKTIVVPHGGYAELGDALQQQGIVATPFLFRAFAVASRGDGPLHAGEFAFPAAASLRQVLTVLRTARPVQHRLTIPEGLTAAQVAHLIDAADALTGDTPVPAEGTILPQTYDYDRGTSREQLLDRARVAMDHALDRAWSARAPGLPLANKTEALVLASIVERETAKPDERPIISAVFLNRLRLGMKLQSDPTVIYGASGGLGGAGSSHYAV